MSVESPNRFLAALSTKSRERLMLNAVEVALPLRTQLYIAEETPQFAYFLKSGLASVVTSTTDGDTVEIGIVGSEDLIGALHVIGPTKVASDCFIQIEGAGWRIPFKQLKTAFHELDDVRERILEFVQEQAVLVGQIAGCNRLHEAELRLARWLLMAQDRTGSNVLGLTHEFLGMMLGTRRTTVSMIAGTFQRLGYIEFTRGRVTILDRPQLEDTACDCYPVMKRLHANLYKTSTKSS